MRSPSAQDPAEQSFSPYLLWIIWLLWLFFLWQPISAFVAAPPSLGRTLGIIGLVVFVVLYLRLTWQNAWNLTRATPTRDEAKWKAWVLPGMLLGLAIILTLVSGQNALGSLIYVSAALIGRLSGRHAVFAGLGLTLLVALLGFMIRAPLGAVVQIFFIVPAVGSFVYYFGYAIRANQELRRARQEIARLAVSEERLRFARDLHDLLGHTLSLITLKSELARRLVSVEPEQAAIEIGDIETAARQALVEVREAVAGYRRATLEDELNAAQELLAAAGIAYREQGEPPQMSPSVEAALAWAVREGVTNVIRHSRAHSCALTFTQTDGAVGVEVRDDGAAHQDTLAGNGLTGLKERVAALGGTCEVGPALGGGWRLAVSIPGEEAQRTGSAAPTVGSDLKVAPSW